MSHNFTTFRNSRVVDVIDQHGTKVDERQLANLPIVELFPDEKFVVIDWMANGKKPSVDEIIKPIVYGGWSYIGYYGWGSAVKTGQTIGFTHDLPKDSSVLANNEDAQRVSRWLTAQGFYGALKGTLKVGIVKPGETVNGNPVEDGFGYIRRDVALTARTERPKIKLGRAKEAHSFWQYVPWSKELEAEFMPRIQDAIAKMTDPMFMLYDQASSAWDAKKELVEADKDMMLHPYVANAIARSRGEFYARKSITADTDGVVGVAVPTLAAQVSWPNHSGKAIIYRHPIDSYSSTQAIEMQPFDAESERIRNLEVVQHTLASKEFFAKGCFGIVDELPNDWDMVVCAEDIKLAKAGVKETRNMPEIELSEAVLVFTQWFDKGTAVGVSAKWAKNLLGLDHDGDLVVMIDANQFPVLWKTVSEYPERETPKLPKTKTPLSIEKRPEMIIKSMANLVGFATNVAAATFLVKDRETLAHSLGYKSVAKMDHALNYFIKAGTDGFKTNIDLDELQKQLSVLQSNLVKVLGGMAPHTKWPNDWAFKRGIPVVIEADLGKDKYKIGGEDQPVTLNIEELSSAIQPWMDGTISQICRITLPHVRNVLSTPIQTKLLTEYRTWAMKVSEDLLASAKNIQDWYNARAKRCNWADAKSINELKLAFWDHLEIWMDAERIDRMTAASALWRVAHSSRSGDASGASVFIGFYDECLTIIREKPGRKGTLRTIVTGIAYQVPGLQEATLEGEIVDVMVSIKGKRVVRKALVGQVDGQLQPRDPQYPANMIGMIATNADQPGCGKYTVSLKQTSQAAWTATLV